MDVLADPVPPFDCATLHVFSVDFACNRSDDEGPDLGYTINIGDASAALRKNCLTLLLWRETTKCRRR
jgi:hypothetical protein